MGSRCLDCPTPLEKPPLGRPPQRCKPCAYKRILAGNRAGYQRAPENQRRRNRERYRANPAKVIARTTLNLRRWQEANREHVRLYNRNRAAKLKGNDAPGVTAEEWRQVCEFFGNRCAYCEEPGKLTIDHVVPIAKGGRDAPDNVVPACKRCNSSKGAKDLDAWLVDRFGTKSK